MQTNKLGYDNNYTSQTGHRKQSECNSLPKYTGQQFAMAECQNKIRQLKEPDRVPA